MKILMLYRFVRCIVTYHFLSSLIVLLVLGLNGASGKPDAKTKLLLHNIRTHLAQKADEIVKKKECESGLILCKNIKKEGEGDEEKSDELPPPPPKSVRGQHKPTIRVNPKDVIQTLMPKAHRSFFRKTHKSADTEKPKPLLHSFEDSDENENKDKSEEVIPKKAKDQSSDLKKPLKFIKKLKQVEQFEAPTPTYYEKRPEVVKADLEEDKNIKKLVKVTPKNTAKSEEAIDKRKEDKKVQRLENLKKKRESVYDQQTKTEEGLIFLQGGSFVFSLDFDGVRKTLCEKHSHIYLKQLKKHQIWALMMYDASAKIPSGILQGNVNQYGDFDECLAINAVFKNLNEKSKKRSGIKGKYCLATIDVTTDMDSKNLHLVLERAESYHFIKSTIQDPGHFIPRFSTINWGLCVPSACLAEDVEKFFKSQLEAFSNDTGLQFDVNVDETNCVVKDDLKFQFQTETTAVIVFYLVVLLISLLATLLDTKTKKRQKEMSKLEVENELKEAAKDVTDRDEYEAKTEVVKLSLKEKMKQIVMAFSLKKNVGKLLSDDNKGAIECIHGIKSIFTVMLYFAHKTIPLGMSAFSNRIFLTKISNQPATVLLRASIIYTDSFLLISGVLTSYNLGKEISEKKKISWARKSVARFIRLTPALLAVVLFYAYVWDQLGSGPIWNLIVTKNSSLCRKYMWRNLLYIQNLFAFENMCAPQTHQLALDMQLSLLAPLFVHLMHTYDKAGVGILQAFFILSSMLRYITASNNNLSVVIYHGMSVSQLYKTANLLYGQTFHRASPYILGTIVGYHLKKFEKRFDMPKFVAALGWILSLTFGLYSVVSPSALALRAYQYDVQEAAQYAALSPVAWSLALSWLIVTCHLGYGGLLNKFLCRKIFLVFSRISYSVYLTQFLVFFYNAGIKRIPELFTFTGSLNVTEFFIVIGLSVIVTLLFDIPMMEIKKIILDKATNTLPPEEGDVHSKHDEHSKHKSVEVSESGESEVISRQDSQETTEGMLETIDEGEYEEEEMNIEDEEINVEDEEINVECELHKDDEDTNVEYEEANIEDEEGNVEDEEANVEDEEANIEDEEGNIDDEEGNVEDEEVNVEDEEENMEDEEVNMEDEEGNAEDEVNAEEEENVEDESEIEKKNDVIEEVFVIRPLRRSTRMLFSEEPDDQKVFKNAPDVEDEQK